MSGYFPPAVTNLSAQQIKKKKLKLNILLKVWCHPDIRTDGRGPIHTIYRKNHYDVV